MAHKNAAQLKIIGFGSQAQAWGLNLVDSGTPPSVLLRKQSASLKKAQELGLQTELLEDFKSDAPCWFALLTPDDTHSEILDLIAPKVVSGSTFVYAHGQSIVSDELDKKYPQFNHALLAPKAIANQVRSRFKNKGPLGAVYDIRPTQKQETTTIKEKLLKLAKDIGINRGPYPATFEQETHADLYSEQTLLCSAIPYLAKMSYEKLVEKGIPSELAYMECWFELKLIVDTLCEKGPEEFFNLISPAALIGGEKARHLLFDSDYEAKLDRILNDIQTNKFQSQLKESDAKTVRESIVKQWCSSPLQKAHESLGQDFFPPEKVINERGI